MHDGAVGLGEVTGLEPGVGVDELVHADRQQGAVGQAEGSRTERAGADQGVVHALDGVADRAPEEGEGDTDGGADEGHDDRDEAAAVEEAEPVDQLGAVVALPQHGAEQADHDAAEDPRILDGGRLVLAGQDLVRGDREGRQHVLVDQVADQRREGGRAVRLLGVADRDTHGEEQRQVREQRVARGEEHRGDLVPAQTVLAEDIGTTEPDEQTGGGQYGDGQLEAAAHLLQALEEALAELLGGARRRGRVRRRRLHRGSHGGRFLTAWGGRGGAGAGPPRTGLHHTWCRPVF